MCGQHLFLCKKKLIHKLWQDRNSSNNSLQKVHFNWTLILCFSSALPVSSTDTEVLSYNIHNVWPYFICFQSSVNYTVIYDNAIHLPSFIYKPGISKWTFHFMQGLNTASSSSAVHLGISLLDWSWLLHSSRQVITNN